ncbi:MAG: GatB/YqeY domain-containing protein [Candidatus Marinimicrobia bacterium]|nr:GatB/YqeY domain-containing protein [Candidatus Neomarinimicrobiota bacterium]MCF7840703.1 GatB/YqeY domain-containing protein [Candidatus Neomarinimicrobiota bacterium]MCF7903495.1 GatB/YqeY domain-containing protein [Candidatus Neomarinimicrobiota bacterium]
MNFIDELNSALKDAMRSKNQVKLKVIRELKDRIKNWEIQQGKTATETEFLKLVQIAVKQRRESITLYKKGDRQDLVDSEQAELALLEAYLPKMLTATELVQLVDRVITETGAKDMSDIGKVMPVVMKAAAGRADGKQVQELVRAKLQNG